MRTVRLPYKINEANLTDEKLIQRAIQMFVPMDLDRGDYRGEVVRRDEKTLHPDYRFAYVDVWMPLEVEYEVEVRYHGRTTVRITTDDPESVTEDAIDMVVDEDYPGIEIRAEILREIT